jgi:RNA polymerase sigma-70 factor (ECF subfamily)
MSSKLLDNWFMQEVLPLEPKLMAFLHSHWGASGARDLRQEIYIRIYESAQKRFPDNTAAFVFTIARNLIFDKIRRSKIIAFDSVPDFESLQISLSHPSIEDRFDAHRELNALQAAVEQLPERCRKVFKLRKIEGYSQKEVAKKLSISESTIEKQIAKGIRLVADSLYSSDKPFSDKAPRRGIVKKLNKNDADRIKK